ncbi:MAG: hypothetical protein A3B47_00210 [Candidatus Levybacteria bacterium RIFCSPLOWO2_01_FULL_39_24]|nr:MAG: hypothetical protein A2800_00980 [Candidatus Levybacteria bacterium RIFCSPHIGHO2_01_FULL_40_16]OGH46199.1 MAG: hypothetical protein A3B47_00210 [Candidatus Levybacteria bacterium RIFCSPLOWO2_01_FULL_39_24]
MKKNEILFLLFILVGAFAVRLYHFSWPIADWHSWRQTDTSAVSRNFVQNGFDVLHPKFEDLSSSVSLIDNPQGYRFVEFPFYNILQAGLFETFQKFTIEEWGRLVTISFSLISIIFLYLLVKKYTSVRAGLFAAFFYAFIPYNIYYGRAILPDSLMLASFLAAIYFFSQYLDNEYKKNLYYFLGIISLAIAFLIKPYVAFYILPFAYLIYSKYGIKGFMRLDMWLFFLLSILPFGLWRMWMSQYPAGIPRNNWLWNGTGIRFRPAFFQWIFAERIAKLILGYWGLIFVILGLVIKPLKKEGWLFLTFIISSLMYLFTFATGNVQHDYYQMLIIPTLAIFFAKGFDGILRLGKEGVLNYKIGLISSITAIIFMLAFGWFAIRDYYSIQHPNIIAAGRAVDQLVPEDAKVIAPYGGDTTFLYFTNRQGWPVFDRSFKKFKEAGASHIAFADPTSEDLNLEELFKPVVITSTYAIFDMTKPTPEGLMAQQKKD